MALDQSALLDLLGELKLTDVTDRIRVATEALYQELIDAEATAFIGAAPFERSGDRTTHRNGTRAHPDDHSRGPRPEDPEAARRLLLSGAAGATPPRRPGVVRCRDGGLRSRRLDPQSRRPRQSARC